MSCQIAYPRSLFLCDFCYITNYFTFAYFLVCILKVKYPTIFSIFLSIDGPNRVFGPIIFRVLFGWSTGVLAAAVALFRNSLVFHSFDHMCILAVHIGPPLVLYGMRWYSIELEKQWPDTFHFACGGPRNECEGTFGAIVGYSTIAYILLWSIPYSLLMFCYLGKEVTKNGWVTMYSYYEDSLFPPGWDKNSPFSPTINEKIKPLLYMLLHGTLSFISFLVAYLCWQYFWLHTVYLLSMLSVSIYNGATYYFIVMRKQILKEIKAEEEENRMKTPRCNEIIKATDSKMK